MRIIESTDKHNRRAFVLMFGNVGRVTTPDALRAALRCDETELTPEDIRAMHRCDKAGADDIYLRKQSPDAWLLIFADTGAAFEITGDEHKALADAVGGFGVVHRQKVTTSSRRVTYGRWV